MTENNCSQYTLLSQNQIALLQKIDESFESLESQQLFLDQIIENGIGLVLLNNLKRKLSNELIGKLELLNDRLKIIHHLQKNYFSEVFEQLKYANVEFIVLKGWALSYSVYPEVHHRPKTDIDILIQSKDKKVVKNIFEKHNFKNPRGWEPETIIDQFTMMRPIIKGVSANVDIHLKISDDKLIQNVLTWEYIHANCVENQQLHVNIPNRAFLITHAAVHLLHHYIHCDLVKLVWLYDIYLIFQQCLEEDISQLIELQQKTGLSGPVVRVLQEVQAAFPDAKIRQVIETMNLIPTDKKFRYLLTSPSVAKSYLRKLKQTKGIASKALLLKETILPPTEEINRKYGKVQGWLYPFYYLHRLITGIKRNLFKNHSD